MKPILAAIVAAAVLLGSAGDRATADPPIGHYQDFGDAKGFLNILPPGQDGTWSAADAAAGNAAYAPHMRDQLAMYSDLVYNAPALPDDRLTDFFKDASFGVPQNDIDRVYSPTAGVTVIRDRSFGVPHIFGTTRYATMYAQGYTAAEDRLFLMDVLRHLGRARLSEFLGNTPANQSLDRGIIADAPYTEADLTAQIAAMQASGAEGAAIVSDGAAYVLGVNAYITEALSDSTKLPFEYTALGATLNPWVAEDTIAIAAQVGAQFGKGGGGEVGNHCGLKSLAIATGSAVTARTIFDDLHLANDDEAPTTSPDAAPYMTNLGPVNPAAHPDIDCATLDAVIDNPGGGAFAAPTGGGDALVTESIFGDQTSASNALVVSGAHTATGAPIAIFGPQTGYFMPQLLVEKDVHGPGIDARGASFAGVDVYVQLGRGTNYAWSATSSGADNVDQWVLELCVPGGGTPTTASMGYMHNATCKPIETYQHNQSTTPPISWRVERTPDYGPISQRGTLTNGTPIAIAQKRSTYGAELESARGFYRVNDPAKMANGFSDFRNAMGAGSDYTFNWLYVDATNIGYQHSCKCPQRATGVDPYLPAWGNGSWDWQGYIPLGDQPFSLNPAQGYLASWNNKQAPEFMANDRNFGYGPVYRSQRLESRIQDAIAGGNIDRAQMADIMEDAGTVDLRGQEVLPLLLQTMAPTLASQTATAQDMFARLTAWEATGAHRRDANHDGEYDDPQAPAIMDAFWSPLVHAMFDTSSSNAISHLGIGIHDAPSGHNGSAFQGGMYSHVQKDLRQVLGAAVIDPFSQTYCGAGNLATCAASLWTALNTAATTLQTQFGTPIVANWKRAVVDDDVRSSGIGVSTVPAFHWIDRPTFQQLVQINAGCLSDGDCDGVTDVPDNCAAAPNPSQLNSDRNLVDLSPPKSYDDVTLANSDDAGNLCDPDDDNDGLADLTEAGGPPCATATGATNPLVADTDGDLVLDGAECTLGFNPILATSKPSQAQCGAAADGDGDGLPAYREFCAYGTSNASANTDGDLCGDARELASINADMSVTAVDLSQVAQSFGLSTGPNYIANFDFTRNGDINATDLSQIAQRFGACTP